MSASAVPTDASDVRLPRGRRYTVRALLVLATILAVLSIFAVWADRQLFNADNWADTSSQLLDSPAVRGAVAGFLVDEVYANVNVPEAVGAQLPPRLQGLAGPAAGA